ncbi:MAG: prolipoprotein diacylglyceryl transferase [Lachnospiraceae bacterium]|nr:prolipoprotein diacylglyceryl transferase [Lachnospiraceae bacterium]
MVEIMGDMDIAFPHLGIYLRDVPKSFVIGNFSIALYGIIIACAMLAGLSMAAWIAKRTGQNPDHYWDLGIWLIIFTIVGARIYYVIFSWDYYKDDLLQIFNLRGGGLAIYGGVIAGVLTVAIYARRKKLSVPLMMDTCSYGLVLGQIIGRWGNFFNREVFGEYTDSLLAMRLPVSMVRERDISELIRAHMTEGTNYIQVHPTFLYEGLWNLGLLLLMLFLLKKKHFDGEMALLYFAGYGIGRAWIELIRTDQLYITGTRIPVSMALGLAVAAVCIVVEIVIMSRRKKERA